MWSCVGPWSTKSCLAPRRERHHRLLQLGGLAREVSCHILQFAGGVPRYLGGRADPSDAAGHLLRARSRSAPGDERRCVSQHTAARLMCGSAYLKSRPESPLPILAWGHSVPPLETSGEVGLTDEAAAIRQRADRQMNGAGIG